MMHFDQWPMWARPKEEQKLPALLDKSIIPTITGAAAEALAQKVDAQMLALPARKKPGRPKKVQP